MRAALHGGRWAGKRIVQRLRTGGKIKDMELHIRAKSGNVVTLRYYGESIELDGEAYLLSAFVDVTEQRRAEEDVKRSVSLLRATLDSTADGILVVGLAGEIADFNARFAEMWRLPEDIISSRNDQRALEFVFSG